jgi:hypothetical protein
MACSAAEVIRIQALFSDQLPARSDIPTTDAVQIPVREQDVAPSFSFRDLSKKSALSRLKDFLTTTAKGEEMDIFRESDTLDTPPALNKVVQPGIEPPLETMSRAMPSFHPVQKHVVAETPHRQRRTVPTIVYLAGGTSR